MQERVKHPSYQFNVKTKNGVDSRRLSPLAETSDSPTIYHCCAMDHCRTLLRRTGVPPATVAMHWSTIRCSSTWQYLKLSLQLQCDGSPQTTVAVHGFTTSYCSNALKHHCSALKSQNLLSKALNTTCHHCSAIKRHKVLLQCRRCLKLLMQCIQAWQTTCPAHLNATSYSVVSQASNILQVHREDSPPLRKHASSNILKISQPKTESFQIKILIFFIFLLKI